MDGAHIGWPATLGIAGVATAVATVASLGMSVIWRIADRERVEWAPFLMTTQGGDVDGQPVLVGYLANVGHGTALAVKVHGFGCSALLTWHDEQGDGGAAEMFPALKTGDRFMVSIWCEPQEWGRARLAVAWTAAPRLIRKRRVRLIALRDLAAHPADIAAKPADRTRSRTRQPHQQGHPPGSPPLPSYWSPASRWRALRKFRRSR
ncbi:hypothetical protein LQF12_02325 [Ruania suaedae]|uniref:hypothetical protein n=1 Tax=Ruania suaedae TaxID=2897774 RepID=UPI001E47124D|nr:hypothetical protein [Ruania suaedae]UFU03469.1 hypothetical protein LQF12_02325 [Ruania suaedae]